MFHVWINHGVFPLASVLFISCFFFYFPGWILCREPVFSSSVLCFSLCLFFFLLWIYLVSYFMFSIFVNRSRFNLFLLRFTCLRCLFMCIFERFQSLSSTRHWFFIYLFFFRKVSYLLWFVSLEPIFSFSCVYFPFCVWGCDLIEYLFNDSCHVFDILVIVLLNF